MVQVLERNLPPKLKVQCADNNFVGFHFQFASLPSCGCCLQSVIGSNPPLCQNIFGIPRLICDCHCYSNIRMVVTKRGSNRATVSPIPRTLESDLASNLKPRNRMPATPLSNTKAISPSQFKSIFLHEWWLVNPQAKGLAVGGVASMERERVFLSTVIAKRHEANVLETEDGITIIFRGFINRSRTRGNGFPSEVCHHFLFGFPHDWKKYTAHSFGDEYIDGVTGFGDLNACSQKRADDALPFSIHDIDLTRRQDFLLSNNVVLNFGSVPKKICTGLGNSLGNVSKQSESTDNMECNITVRTMECECKDNTTSLKTSQPQVEMMPNGENGVSGVAVESQAGNPKSGHSLMDMNDPNPCTGLYGKSSVRSPISTKKMRKDQLSDCKEKKRFRQEILEDAGNSCNRMVTRSISKRSHTTTLLGKDEKVTVTCVSSPVRRSARLCNCKK